MVVELELQCPKLVLLCCRASYFGQEKTPSCSLLRRANQFEPLPGLQPALSECTKASHAAAQGPSEPCLFVLVLAVIAASLYHLLQACLQDVFCGLSSCSVRKKNCSPKLRSRYFLFLFLANTLLLSKPSFENSFERQAAVA